MKRILPTLVLSCCTLAAQQAEPRLHLQHEQAAQSADPVEQKLPVLRDYTGTLGADAIIATLVIVGPDVRGSYFRLSDLKDIKLAGHAVDDSAQISLAELDADAKPDAEIYLRRVAEPHIPPHQAAPAEQYEGSWTSSDRSRSLPVLLTLRDTMAEVEPGNRYQVAGATDSAAVERNAQAFIAAVLAGNAADAAQHVAFPLVVTMNGRRELLHSAKDFEAVFPKLATPQFLAAVRASPAHAMFATERGIRLGSGEVLFNADGQAFALDNEPVKMFAGRKFLSNKGYAPKPRKKTP